MSERSLRSLEDMNCVLQTGFAFKSSDYAFEGIPIVKIGNIQNKRVTISESNSFFPEGLVESKIEDYYLADGDVLIAMTGQGSVGRVGKMILADSERALLNQRVGKFICDEVTLNREFLFYILTSDLYQDFLFNTGVGSGQPNLSPDLILKTKIPDLPYNEQEAIAGVLGSLDDKIDLLQRQNKTLEGLAQTLFRHWFVDGAEDDWKEYKLEAFVEVMRGLSYKGAGLTEEGEGVPMHNLNSVYEGGGYKYEGIKYYNGEYQTRHKVFPGDIIVTNTEQGHNMLLIGYPGIVPRFFGDEGIFSQHIYRLKIFNPQITNQFLYYQLMSYDVREQITGATNGSTVNMLPKDGIEWATFRLPPQQLIKRFSEMVQPYWDKKESNYTQIQTLEKLRDTLLPKLMSGAIRIQMNFG